MSARIQRAILSDESRDVAEVALVQDDSGIVAPFSLRCGAILIDYILLAGLVVFSVVVTRSTGGSSSDGGFLGVIGLLLAVALLVINFFVLVWARGQTIGKWATGLRIVRVDGSPVTIVTVLLRHLLGYPLSLLPMGLGLLLAVVNRRGRALHDIVAGTRVIMDG